MAGQSDKKTLFDHHLLCSKCGKSFIITSEDNDNTKLDLPHKFCPNCGAKGKVQLNPNVFTITQPSVNARRGWNRAASIGAIRMAAEQKKIDHELGLDRKTTVSPPEGEGQKQSYQLPEATVKKIEEKIKPSVEKISRDL